MDGEIWDDDLYSKYVYWSFEDSLNVISYGCTPGGLALAACVYCGD